jgi:hypothetical protein
VSSAGDFVKLYGSILDSSIWLEPAGTRLLWITMLAMADAEGVVTASVRGLASRARITKDSCLAGLATLSSPDPDSKNPENEGRRIEKVDGGWVILNQRAYRDRRTRTQELTAERTRRWRERQAGGERPAEAAPAPKKGQKFDPLAVPIPLELQGLAFEEAWRAFVQYRRKIGKPFKSEAGPLAAFRHLAPLGPERAAAALTITQEKDWLGVEHGVSELERRSPTPAPAPRESAHRRAQHLELERRKVIAEAFEGRDLTAEQRDSIIEAANRATCTEDLARILWPT